VNCSAYLEEKVLVEPDKENKQSTKKQHHALFVVDATKTEINQV
jgi:hypothetical protein